MAARRRLAPRASAEARQDEATDRAPAAPEKAPQEPAAPAPVAVEPPIATPVHPDVAVAAPTAEPTPAAEPVAMTEVSAVSPPPVEPPPEPAAAEPEVRPEPAEAAAIPAIPAPPPEPVAPPIPEAPAPPPAQEPSPAASEVVPPVAAPAAREPEAPPAPEAAAVPEAPRLPPSIDDILASPRKKRVHKVLSDEQIEAEIRGTAARNTAALNVDGARPAPAGPPGAASAAPAGGQAADDQASLEDLLKEQGIVQHKPKKGRRIVEDDQTVGVAPVAPPPPRGVSIFAPNEPKNKPIRFLDPATIQREREARNRKAGRGGKRKEVVQRGEALYSAADRRRRKGRGTARSAKATELTTPAAHKRVIRIHGGVTVADLADSLGVKGGQLVRVLVGMGQMVTLNERLDLETAQVVAAEFEYEVEDISFKEEDHIEQLASEEVEEGLEPRAPVVTIMGHVDHGKTTILDAIRHTRVAEGEAGGITQHVSAFDVEAGGQRITFVDTPGHAAFTAMRARGAQMTDIVVLVVAASEGVMPQTVEVISHAKAAEVPIIVAMNKMDLKEANADRTKQQLSEQGLLAEDWGGDVQVVPISARKGEGIDDLLEAINLQAEMLELAANPQRPASGRVVEAQFEKGRGPVAIVLVQRGTLKSGDIVVAGTEFGRIRAMFETDGKPPKKLKDAGPSTPVAILGLSGLPEAGDEFNVVKTDKDAKVVVEHRRDTQRAQQEHKREGVSLEDLYRRMQEGEDKELNLIIKADVQGSIEALKKVFGEIEVRDTSIKILHSAVGGVTEGDVMLAEASDAVIVGFGVRPDSKAAKLAEQRGIDIRTYRIIYEAVDEIRAALIGMLEPEFKEKVLGHAEVRDLFKISKIGTVAGCSVQDGKIARNHSVRVLRNQVVTWEGKLKSLRRFKDDVREVLQGYECGIGLDGFDDVKVGDILEAFMVEEIRPEA